MSALWVLTLVLRTAMTPQAPIPVAVEQATPWLLMDVAAMVNSPQLYTFADYWCLHDF